MASIARSALMACIVGAALVVLTFYVDGLLHAPVAIARGVPASAGRLDLVVLRWSIVICSIGAALLTFALLHGPDTVRRSGPFLVAIVITLATGTAFVRWAAQGTEERRHSAVGSPGTELEFAL